MDTATTTARRAAPWNKGKLLGQKPPLKLKEIWASGFVCNWIIESGNSHCSTWQLIASCVGAIWSDFASTMLSKEERLRHGQLSCRGKPSGRCNLRSPSNRGTRSPGSGWPA